MRVSNDGWAGDDTFFEVVLKEKRCTDDDDNDNDDAGGFDAGGDKSLWG